MARFSTLSFNSEHKDAGHGPFLAEVKCHLFRRLKVKRKQALQK